MTHFYHIYDDYIWWLYMMIIYDDIVWYSMIYDIWYMIYDIWWYSMIYDGIVKRRMENEK